MSLKTKYDLKYCSFSWRKERSYSFAPIYILTHSLLFSHALFPVSSTSEFSHGEGLFQSELHAINTYELTTCDSEKGERSFRASFLVRVWETEALRSRTQLACLGTSTWLGEACVWFAIHDDNQIDCKRELGRVCVCMCVRVLKWEYHVRCLRSNLLSVCVWCVCFCVWA